MSDDMTTKYQQHYNQILTGTLTDSIMKSISYQANIKLANEIIAEQEKTITDLQTENESIKSELSTVNKIKVEYETLKAQSSNADIFRNHLIKERESHQKTKDVYDSQIDDLKQKIEVLENPPKKKKVKSVPGILVQKEEQLETVTDVSVKDGGSF